MGIRYDLTDGDIDLVAEIQGFTSAVTKRGFNVIGGIVTPEGRIYVFATGRGDDPKQERLKIMADALHYAVHHGNNVESISTSLTEN